MRDGQHPKFLKVARVNGEQTFTLLAAWLCVRQLRLRHNL